jgi:hypothetical protein
MKHLFYILIFLTSISCIGKKTPNKTNLQKLSVESNNSSRKKEIRDFISDTNYYHWAAMHSDTSKYMLEITFHNEYAIYWYHGQCQYFYFAYLCDNKIELLWSYKTDCILNMDFLEKSNGIKWFPKRGDLFASYSLINDTMLKVDYNFPEWVKRINKMQKDSIFPTFLYFKK